MNKEKEYIEAEIVDDKTNYQSSENNFSKRAYRFGADFASQKASENIDQVKQQIVIKSIVMLLPYILGTLIFLFLVFGLIFLIFDTPFDYILSAVLLYFMIRGMMKVLRVLRIKK